MLPRVPPVSVQVKVAPMLPVTDWPVPTPVVVQAAAAIAISDAAAALIGSAVIVSLLSSLKRRISTVAPLALRVHSFVCASEAQVHPQLAFWAMLSHRRARWRTALPLRL